MNVLTSPERLNLFTVLLIKHVAPAGAGLNCREFLRLFGIPFGLAVPEPCFCPEDSNGAGFFLRFPGFSFLKSSVHGSIVIVSSENRGCRGFLPPVPFLNSPLCICHTAVYRLQGTIYYEFLKLDKGAFYL